MNALKKINERAKALKKKHPGKKYKTLQKQAGSEYRAGKLTGTKKKLSKSRVVTKKRKVSRRKVGKAPIVYSLGKLIRKRRKKLSRRKPVAQRRYKKVVVKVKSYQGRRKQRVSGMKSLMPVFLVGGLGLLAYMLLKPATPVLSTTTNVQRNASASNLVSYATAAGLGISAITQLINSLNSMSDSDVINANSNPASAVAQLTGPVSTVQAPTGLPGLFQI